MSFFIRWTPKAFMVYLSLLFECMLIIRSHSCGVTAFLIKTRHTPVILRPATQWPSFQQQQQSRNCLYNRMSSEEDSSRTDNNTRNDSNPIIRTSLLGLSLLGLADTSYLTYTKLFNPPQTLAFCNDESSSCHSVLDSSFADVHVGNIHFPLSLLGMISYTVTSVLSLQPVVPSTVLLSWTTAMATFSSFLIYILLNVLHQSCPYCIVSAILSLSMATLCWWTEWKSSSTIEATDSSTSIQIIPENNTSLLRIPSKLLYGSLSFIGTTLVAWTLFFSSSTISSAAAQQQESTIHYPPPITTTSSPEALLLGQKLHALHAKMYGAYWCSHCYEQKQRLGQQVFEHIEGSSSSTPLVSYIECEVDGFQSQRKMCKEQKIPGYPTWEIDGVLYPGEMYLNELQDIVEGKSSSTTALQ